MTGAEFKRIRTAAGLTQSRMATALRISDKRAVRHWEYDKRRISGPISILMEMLDAGSIIVGAEGRMELAGLPDTKLC